MTENDAIAVPATTHLFLVDEGGILYSESERSLHVLNTGAAYVWCALEDGQALATIKQNLLAAGDRSDREIDVLLGGLIGTWTAQGLLQPRERSREYFGEPSPTVLPPPGKPAVTKTYALLDSEITVGYADPAQARAVHPVLAHLERPGGGDGFQIELTREDGGHAVWVEGRRRFRDDDLGSLAPEVKYHVMTLAMRDYDHIFNIHAGVLGHGGACLLLPGVKGSGKTSLTTALVAAGFDYLSDEVAPLKRSDCTVRPVPLSVCIKESGLALQETLFPQVAGLAVYQRQDSMRVRYLPIPAASTAPGDRDHPIRWVVFPRYREGGSNILTPLDKLTGLKRLVEEFVAVPRALALEDVARLVHHLERVAYFELDTGDIDGAVAAIRAMVAT